jgi:hypothetical protein
MIVEKSSVHMIQLVGPVARRTKGSVVADVSPGTGFREIGDGRAWLIKNVSSLIEPK